MAMKKCLWSGAAAALLVSCAAPQRPPFDVNAFGVYVAAEHSGSAITLEPGQVLVVRLVSDVNQIREWTLLDFVPGVLVGPTAPVFERPPPAANLDVTLGAAVWRFKPAAAGTVTLKFEYRHPRSLEPATQTVNYAVTVR
ncbi:MAG: protease inhibitor I42 family protein [Burkholderiales bacterium]